MSKSAPLTYAQRASRYRAGARERGEPLLPEFDRAIRSEVISAYRTGRHQLTIQDLMGAVVNRLIAEDPSTVTRRGCVGLLNRLQRSDRDRC